MVKVNLTDRYLKALQPPVKGRLDIRDGKRPSLRFRITTTGATSWVYEKRVKGGGKIKKTVGTWPLLSLADARKLALVIDAEAERGHDRFAAASLAKEEAEARKDTAITVSAVLDKYDALKLAKLRSGAERRRQLDQILADRMNLPMENLTQIHLQAVIDDKAAEGKTVMANRLRAAARAFTAWAFGREDLAADIGFRLEEVAKERPRERVLSMREVRAIYECCDSIGELFGPVFKLMVLTGQRRMEILALNWAEVDLAGRRIVKPGSATKNGKPHITHLSDPALGILKALQQRKGGLVFTTTGDTPPSAVSKAKARLDRAVERALDEEVPHWRLHDLRTAMATALAEAGEPEGVVDRILNHSASGSAPSAVARVYQMSDLLPQRARALDLWARMVASGGADVLPLRRDRTE